MSVDVSNGCVNVSKDFVVGDIPFWGSFVNVEEFLVNHSDWQLSMALVHNKPDVVLQDFVDVKTSSSLSSSGSLFDEFSGFVDIIRARVAAGIKEEADKALGEADKALGEADKALGDTVVVLGFHVCSVSQDFSKVEFLVLFAAAPVLDGFSIGNRPQVDDSSLFMFWPFEQQVDVDSVEVVAMLDGFDSDVESVKLLDGSVDHLLLHLSADCFYPGAIVFSSDDAWLCCLTVSPSFCSLVLDDLRKGPYVEFRIESAHRFLAWPSVSLSKELNEFRLLSSVLLDSVDPIVLHDTVCAVSDPLV